MKSKGIELLKYLEYLSFLSTYSSYDEICTHQNSQPLKYFSNGTTYSIYNSTFHIVLQEFASIELIVLN